MVGEIVGRLLRGHSSFVHLQHSSDLGRNDVAIAIDAFERRTVPDLAPSRTIKRCGVEVVDAKFVCAPDDTPRLVARRTAVEPVAERHTA